jgi:hypothetical protein
MSEESIRVLEMIQQGVFGSEYAKQSHRKREGVEEELEES